MKYTMNRYFAGRIVPCVLCLFLVSLPISLLVGCSKPGSPQAAKSDSGAADADTSEPATDDAAGEDAAAGDAGKTSESEEKVEVTSCDGTNTAKVAKDLRGAPLARALMEQWKDEHSGTDWVEEEKRAHAFNPPADNSDLLEGGQGSSHAYGNFTAQDLIIWNREAEKLVAEGSRIFHSGDELGSTVAVSCDMCHPHAANTHPETYPKYQTQLGRVALLRDMINWCVQNPVRAEPLDPDGAKMRALEAYIMAQRKGVEMNYGKH